ncbi:MAG: hypothetical protein ACTSVI_03125 [Promethearchaeota archaeon]
MFGGNAIHGSNLLDDDNDGLTNTHEITIGTNTSKADTDGDGIPDGQEINAGNDTTSVITISPHLMAILALAIGVSIISLIASTAAIVKIRSKNGKDR